MAEDGDGVVAADDELHSRHARPSQRPSHLARSPRRPGACVSGACPVTFTTATVTLSGVPRAFAASTSALQPFSASSPAHGLAQLVVFHHVVEAVAAHDERIAPADGEREPIHRGDELSAEAAREHGAIRMAFARSALIRPTRLRSPATVWSFVFWTIVSPRIR